MPMILALARLDDGVSPPDRLLSAFIHAAMPPTDPKPPRDMLQFFRRDTIPLEPDSPVRSRLLIYGWDELPAERRALWRAALLEAAQTQPAVAIALTLPIWEPAWPAFTPLALAPLSPALLTRWIEQLAPAEQRGPLQELLTAEAAPHPLAERLFEVALLAWLAPFAALPRTRGALYKQTIAQLLKLPIGQLDHAPILRELQMLAAYGEPPAKISTGLIELGGGGIPHFAHPQANRYLAARQLVSEQRYTLLHQLDEPRRAARLLQHLQHCFPDFRVLIEIHVLQPAERLDGQRRPGGLVRGWRFRGQERGGRQPAGQPPLEQIQLHSQGHQQSAS
jgi:hypothetical protein